MAGPAHNADRDPNIVQANTSAAAVVFPIQGAGPDVAQARRARAGIAQGFISDRVTQQSRNQRVNYCAADLRSPQIFAAHPNINLEAPTAVPEGDANPTLSARALPAGVWDGNPGNGAPTF